MEEEKEKKTKQGFFQKVWSAITKIENYPSLAAEGLGKAFSYICKIVAIFAVILCLGMLYQSHQIMQEGIRYLQNEFPEFTYKEGTLEVLAEKRLTIAEEDSYVGRTIIDTKVEDDQTINQYINELNKAGRRNDCSKKQSNIEKWGGCRNH